MSDAAPVPAAQATDLAAAASAVDSGAATAAAAGTTVPVTAEAPWYSGLSEDLSGYVQNKGWQDPASVVESYRNAEKLLGVPADQVIKMPKPDAGPDAWNAEVWNKLGRPESPEGYGFKAPEDGDGTFAEWAQGAFHEIGVPREMGTQIAQKYEEFVQGIQQQQHESYEATVAQEQEQLRKDWGAAHDQNIALAKRAANEFGIDAQTIDLLESQVGFAKVMEMFHNIGSKMGEAEFVGGNSPSGFGVMTPEQARSQINTLRGDAEFVRRYTNGDAAARAEMEKLHKWAYPAEE